MCHVYARASDYCYGGAYDDGYDHAHGYYDRYVTVTVMVMAMTITMVMFIGMAIVTRS